MQFKIIAEKEPSKQELHLLLLKINEQLKNSQQNTVILDFYTQQYFDWFPQSDFVTLSAFAGKAVEMNLIDVYQQFNSPTIQEKQYEQTQQKQLDQQQQYAQIQQQDNDVLSITDNQDNVGGDTTTQFLNKHQAIQFVVTATDAEVNEIIQQIIKLKAGAVVVQEID
ncbi:Hypothetical_protein [Hexamita inflata]|uniref:Hypothetical_protein n=1 Tax=Hexamita inflata TaxID=28002 RepID=A0AA86ULI5_9EUKA|nr:Hypothetical protein HINF_LOCUS31683 [Hexamita inflata]